ncbi:MAG: AGE family epimerase/isomerase [Bacteroidales bacterium]|nr:AGE family epimerase/isomerase [Bacteroidales bacterium]
MNTTQKEYLQQCRDAYRSELIDNIMPFWMEHGLDRVNGGVYTCLDRDGKLMDTTKSVWFQGRFGFICAYAYNNIEKRQEWLDASLSCIKFLEDHCVDTDGHKFFTVTAEGEGIQKRRYVFSECFCAIAMAEYAKATGSKEYAEKALKEFQNIRRMMATPGFLPAKTTVPGRSHSIIMILLNVAVIVKQVIEHPDLDAQIESSLYDIEHYFMHPEFEALLESVTPEGGLIDTIAGRVINPGHCIETAWFIMECAKDRADSDHLNEVALRILDWSWKWGWDEQHGGIINFKDCKNFPPQDYSQDMKFWWPQCETIIATLYAYKLTGDEKYLEMHRLANDWTFKHFKDTEYPEWYGYLHRDGSVAQPAKGNIFKGPFHIPRMLIKAGMLCDEIIT